MREGIRMTIMRMELVLRVGTKTLIIRNNVGEQMNSHMLVPEAIQYLWKKSEKVLLAEHIVPENDVELTVRILQRCHVPGLAHDGQKELNVLTREASEWTRQFVVDE